MSVSRETAELLAEYARLIRKWNGAINLVAPATLDTLEQRHIADSAQVFHHASPQEGSWIDLGSGGGLPGIVVAIFARALPMRVILIESDKRKSAFLTTVRRELNLPKIEVKSTRIQSLEPGHHTYTSARALAPLNELMPHLAPGYGLGRAGNG